MKAVVYERYGPADELRLADRERPVPTPDEVLVRVHAVAVTRADCATREANRQSGRGTMLLSRLIFGIRRPRRQILGSEFAARSRRSAQPRPGSRSVTRSSARPAWLRGIRGIRPRARERAHRTKPAGLTFEEAAAICDGGLNALWCLRQGAVGKDERVLVYGASGAIGTAGVQLAKHFGAEVTAVCGTRNLELVRSLGADAVVDYTQDDFTPTASATT